MLEPCVSSLHRVFGSRATLVALTLSLGAACGGTSGGDQAQNGPADVDASVDDMNGPEDPLKVPDGKWTYVEFPDAFCQDGSKAGIAVSPRAKSDSLMIYLEGGGACYDTVTCLANPQNVPDFMKAEKTGGVFNRSKAENPVKDWNYVYVPYCTGDVHAGANPNGMIDGAKHQFVGYTNMGIFLKRIAATFPHVKTVLLTGISAGGFGASANVQQVMDAFPHAEGSLLDDSGPAMSSKYVPTCLQSKWRDLWALDKTMITDCGADCPNKDDFLLDFSLHMAKTYQDRKSGIIESIDDGVISRFFGVGLRNCTGNFVRDAVPADQFKAGLLDFRAQLASYKNFGTWYPMSCNGNTPCTQHTWLGDDGLYTATIGDKKLIDWVTGIVNNTAVSNEGG